MTSSLPALSLVLPEISDQTQKEISHSASFVQEFKQLTLQQDKHFKDLFFLFKSKVFMERTIQHVTQKQILVHLVELLHHQLEEMKSFRMHHLKAHLVVKHFLADSDSLSSQKDLLESLQRSLKEEEKKKHIQQFQERCSRGKRWASTDTLVFLPLHQLHQLDEMEKALILLWQDSTTPSEELFFEKQKQWVDVLVTPVPQFILNQFEPQSKVVFSPQVPALLSSSATHHMTHMTQFASMIARLRQNQDPFQPTASTEKVKVEEKDMHLALSLQPFQSNSLFLKQQLFAQQLASGVDSSEVSSSFSQFGAFQQKQSFISPFQTHYDFLSCVSSSSSSSLCEVEVAPPRSKVKVNALKRPLDTSQLQQQPQPQSKVVVKEKEKKKNHREKTFSFSLSQKTGPKVKQTTLFPPPMTVT